MLPEPDVSQAQQRLIKAMAHPLRFRLLGVLDQRVASPNQLAGEVGEPLGRVSHHVRVLHDLGAIELVKTEPRRGAVEHFYRALLRPVFDDEMWEQLPRVARRGLFADNLRRIRSDVAAAGAGNGFDHPRAHVSYTLLELDDQGMDAVAEVLIGAVEQVLAIRAAAAERLRGRSGLRTEVAILHFTRP